MFVSPLLGILYTHADTHLQVHTTTTVINVETSIPIQGLGRIEQIAVASITVFVVTSISFIICGLLCGRFCCKQKKVIETDPPSQQENPNLLYENIQPTQHEQLELNENIAYGPIRQHIIT